MNVFRWLSALSTAALTFCGCGVGCVGFLGQMGDERFGNALALLVIVAIGVTVGYSLAYAISPIKSGS